MFLSLTLIGVWDGAPKGLSKYVTIVRSCNKNGRRYGGHIRSYTRLQKFAVASSVKIVVVVVDVVVIVTDNKQVKQK